MTPANVAITIWWKAILLNALLVGLCSILVVEFFFVAVIIALVVGGFIVTLPLVPVIALILKVQRLIPYGNRERIAWLKFMLLLLVWVIYFTVMQLTAVPVWTTEPLFYYMGICTGIAVLSAVALSRKTIDSLNLFS
jgi:hypothetical protein